MNLLEQQLVPSKSSTIDLDALYNKIIFSEMMTVAIEQQQGLTYRSISSVFEACGGISVPVDYIDT
jgi:hypothetical protein